VDTRTAIVTGASSGIGLASRRPIRADTGAVTLIQRFGSAANLNIHLHCLVLDGVWRAASQMGVVLRQHSRSAPKACRSEPLFSHAQVLAPNRSFIVRDKRNGPHRRFHRGIRNRPMNEFRHVSSPPLPFPVQHALTQTVANYVWK
jgi:hypothetical protein